MKRKGSLPKNVSINNIKQLYNKDKIYHQQAKIPETESLNSLLKGKGEHQRGRAELREGINTSEVCGFCLFKLFVSRLFMGISPQRLCYTAGVRLLRLILPRDLPAPGLTLSPAEWISLIPLTPCSAPFPHSPSMQDTYTKVPICGPWWCWYEAHRKAGQFSEGWSVEDHSWRPVGDCCSNESLLTAAWKARCDSSPRQMKLSVANWQSGITTSDKPNNYGLQWIYILILQSWKILFSMSAISLTLQWNWLLY